MQRHRLTPRVLLPVLALAIGCGQDASTPTGPGSATMTVTKVAGDRQTATVHSAVAVPPSVRVVTRMGKPIPGVVVAFGIGLGGGSVSGADAITGSDGIAAVGAWVLGERTGENTLSVTVDGATGVLFSATGLAGPPASIVKTAGDNQYGDIWSFLTGYPAVAVHDAHGNPVAHVMVTFSVATGGGEIFGADQSTDGSGAARVGGWRLGPEPGPNTLEATVAGLPPTTFTAHAVNRCTDPIPYALGSTAEGTLSSSSCRLWLGEYSDRYSASLSSATSLRFDLTSDDAWPRVSLFDATGAALASEAFYCDMPDYCAQGGATSVRVLLAAGDYAVAASVFQYDWGDAEMGGVGGTYTLSSTAIPEDVGGCNEEAPVFIVPGVTTTQRIESTDCVDSYWVRSATYKYFFDRFEIYAVAGRTYTISVSSADFDTYLAVGGIVSDDGSSGSQIEFIPTVSGVHEIRASTHSPDATGSYTLTVELGGSETASPVSRTWQEETRSTRDRSQPR